MGGAREGWHLEKCPYSEEAMGFETSRTDKSKDERGYLLDWWLLVGVVSIASSLAYQ